MPGRLQLKEEVGGLRYYLDNEPVHAGDTVELALANMTWVRGTYEWNPRATNSEPALYLRLLETDAPVAILIPPDAILRWPN